MVVAVRDSFFGEVFVAAAVPRIMSFGHAHAADINKDLSLRCDPTCPSFAVFRGLVAGAHSGVVALSDLSSRDSKPSPARTKASECYSQVHKCP